MDNQNTFSPPPQVIRALLTFPEVMKSLIEGKTIRRKAWDDITEYGLLADGWLSIHREGKFHVWKVNDGDLLATDWMVI